MPNDTASDEPGIVASTTQKIQRTCETSRRHVALAASTSLSYQLAELAKSQTAIPVDVPAASGSPRHLHLHMQRHRRATSSSTCTDILTRAPLDPAIARQPDSPASQPDQEEARRKPGKPSGGHGKGFHDAYGLLAAHSS